MSGESLPQHMSVTEFEEAVFNLEEIRIVVRSGAYEKVGAFNFARKAIKNMNVKAWLDTRILPLIDGRGVVVVDGSGRVPHGRTNVDTVRASYKVGGQD